MTSDSAPATREVAGVCTPPPSGEPPAPPTDTDAKATRALTLDANKAKVKKGKEVLLSGQLDAPENEAGCEAGQVFELQRKKPGQTTFTTFLLLQSDAQGSFSTRLKVRKTFEYRAQVPETATCAGQTSNTEKVKVKKRK
jgi:hypothetical protein